VPRTIRQLQADKGNGRTDFSVEEEWILKYSLAIDVQFIGVWDTVGALGLPFGNLPWFGKADMQFLNTGLRVSNKFAFHAVAIDEHRKAFEPTLWTVDRPISSPSDGTPPRALTQVEQRWFVGAHANVGGGCESDLLAQAPLKWIMAKAQLKGITFRRDVELDAHPEKSPISDSYSQFLHGWYKIATLGRPFHREIGQAPIRSSEETIRSTINETVDASVFDRWRSDLNYRPINLVRWSKRTKVDLNCFHNSVRADDPTVEVD
jgi:type VI secretion system (T6SS) phospholipase Tle1-like effector